MKTVLLLALVVSFFASIVHATEPARSALAGAWERRGAEKYVQLITDDYWTQAIFDRAQPRFVRTLGGTYKLAGDIATGTIEFDSGDAAAVGNVFQVRVTSDGRSLTIQHENGETETWQRIDEYRGPLAGVWRIGERKVGDEMKPMPLQARRTLKVLTGTRFQWIAFNVETGEFSGTGGGTYTLKDGAYVENLEFFSRDASRVGARLSFQADVEGDRWVHRGKSTKGDPIHEVWTRFTGQQP